MENRHLSRSIVLQTLFELDFNGLIGKKHIGGKIERNIKDTKTILARNAKEFASGMEDFSFARKLLDSILEKRENIDTIIEKAAPEWSIDKISTVDRNILRVGLYELLFSDRKEVPAKVAINEAIELAKTFGGESSGRFINGVLGAVYKEIGEPGKEEVSKKKNKKKIEDVPYEKMPIKRLGGAVIYTNNNDNIYIALVHDVFGYWTLSKGGIDEKESKEDGTVRKIKEELGIEVKIKNKLGENEYIASDPKIGKLRKQVVYFLAESKFDDLKLADKDGLDDAMWFKLSDIAELNFYDDILPIVTKAVNILLKK
ncbi:transcription antitermination factor NusB [Candidatus Campbellbacteria bacterium CG10_big_fil_rev_8_21_14_0_10_35_52]|uniref:Transcription antitermination protein NusB n=1 Tax=Candidatus Campbellbacteria bacterium CG10_big_fil_rev_8_21_14_0_10_35_52 TaxID=1974527 RepID=A0A2M6WWC2_9BACT|nr:MAG: transcription antitermination factor NusB [Candidatus Campbellbacteria bacterium CG10_big_fil_rev_8_21_14_0_10_35_52]